MRISLSIIIVLFLFLSLSCKRMPLVDGYSQTDDEQWYRRDTVGKKTPLIDRYPEIPDKTKIISLAKFEKDNNVIEEREAPKCSRLFYNSYQIDIDFYKKEQESIVPMPDIGLDSSKVEKYRNMKLDSINLVEYLTKEDRVIVYKQNDDYINKIMDSTLKKYYFKEKKVDFIIWSLEETKTLSNQCISVMQFYVYDEDESTEYQFYVSFLNAKITDTKLVKIHKKKSTNYVRSYCRLRQKGIFVHSTYLKDCEFSRKAPIHMETNLCYWRYSEIWQVNDEGKFVLLGYTDKRYF